MKFMKMILEVLSKTLTSFLYIALLLVLFLFIYALLGMKLFGGEFNFKDKVYRQNFDSYHEAFMSVFQILSRSYWFYFLFLGFRSNINNFIVSIYLISWIFLGNFVSLNLFLAIILDGFNQAELEIDALSLPDENEIEPKEEKRIGVAMVDKEGNKYTRYKSLRSLDPHKENNDYEALYQKIECQSSFYLFSKANPLRIFLYKISKSRHFENIILCLIVFNTTKMIVDTYYDLGSSSYTAPIEEILTLSFLIETIVKSIASGFCMDKGSYLRETWNILDFVIVVSSIVDIFTSTGAISVITIFRLLRTLRPLRFVSHNVNMKIVVTSLLDSVTSIINVIIVIFVVWLMFAILGISLLGGRMGYCDIPDYYGISKHNVKIIFSKTSNLL